MRKTRTAVVVVMGAVLAKVVGEGGVVVGMGDHLGVGFSEAAAGVVGTAVVRRAVLR